MRGPIRAHESTIQIAVVSRSEIIQLRFRVTVLSGEFDRVTARGLSNTWDYAAPRIEVVVILNGGRGSRLIHEHASRAQVIGDVVLNVTIHIAGEPLASKKDVVCGRSRAVSFCRGNALRA